MTFSAVNWLWLLLPWAALMAWLLQGKRARTAVPFLALWRGPAVARPIRRRLNLPPGWVLAALLAALLAIVAAAGPIWPGKTSHPLDPPPLKPVITLVAVRGRQVMVRVKTPRGMNDPSTTRSSALRVNGQTTRIDLPPAEQSRDFFVDLPTAPSQVDVKLDNQSAIRLRRQQAWPIVEPHGVTSPAVLRMIEVYTRQRQAGEGSSRVIVGTAPSADIILAKADRPLVGLDIGQPHRFSSSPGTPGEGGLGVFFDRPAPTQPSPGLPGEGKKNAPGEMAVALEVDGVGTAGPLRVVDHPLTAGVAWDKALAGGKSSPAPAGDWTPLLAVNGNAILAIHPSPRQVSIGFDAPFFTRSADFVVFWTNVLDWAGDADEVFHTSFAPGNPPEEPAQTKPVTGQNLAPWLVLSALGSLGLALWRRSPA